MGYYFNINSGGDDMEVNKDSAANLKKASRVLNAFSFNPWQTKQGSWLMYFLKPMITGVIFYIHGQIQNKYDKDAYVILDPRMQKDREIAREFLAEWVEPRIQGFMNAAADVFFFFMKEDARYRRLYIVLRNKLILEGQIYALTNTEQDELIKWKGK